MANLPQHLSDMYPMDRERVRHAQISGQWLKDYNPDTHPAWWSRYPERVAAYNKWKEAQAQASLSPAQQARQRLIQEYQDAINKANAANEARYGEAKELLGTVGEQERADLNQRFDESRSDIGQSFANSGLYNSTVRAGQLRGNETARTAAAARLATALAREKVNLLRSKTDQAPSYDMLANLAMQQGRSGYGGAPITLPTITNR